MNTTTANMATLKHTVADYFLFMINEGVSNGTLTEHEAELLREEQTEFADNIPEIPLTPRTKKTRTRPKTEYELFYERETPIIMEEDGVSRREARRIVKKMWVEKQRATKRNRGRPVGTTGASEYQVAIGAIAAHIRTYTDEDGQEISKSRARELARGYWNKSSSKETDVSERANGIIRSIERIMTNNFENSN